MSLLILLLVLNAVLSFSLTTWIFRHAGALQLIQVPNQRSSHEIPTPTSGGVGLIVATTLVGGFVALEQPFLLWGVLGLALPVAVIGLFDDIRHLSIMVRIGTQTLIVAGMLMLLGDMPPWIFREDLALHGWALSALLLLVGIWWINLFNFMDGIDGIAGSQAVTMLLPGAALAAGMHPEVIASPTWILMLCMAMATLGFLVLNWPTARIFMGDVGSNWLAFSIFAVALLSIQQGWLSYSAWLVLAAVFVTDATVTLLTRILRGDRWYEAHRSHAYQRLSRRWRGDRKAGHRSVTVLTIMINLLWLFPLAWACLRFPQWELAWMAMAYLPLILAAVALGAGRSDDEGVRRTA